MVTRAEAERARNAGAWLVWCNADELVLIEAPDRTNSTVWVLRTDDSVGIADLDDLRLATPQDMMRL